MNISLPTYVSLALARLASRGFSAFAVGGCVRDSLLGRTPNDWDLCTNALPEEMLAVFAAFHCTPTGLAHGTLTVIVEDVPLEITTYRLDGEYRDHRRPESVLFTPSLREDLGRRDFTVNAMAYGADGLYDPFGGQEDSKQQLIRAVGDPEKRFTEDALRILRAARLAATLDFTIEEKTAAAMERLAESLSFTSAERQAAELRKLIVGVGAPRILNENRKVLFALLPELAPTATCTQENPHHVADVFRHTLLALKNTRPDPIIRLAVLLHDSGKPACKTIGEDGVAHFYDHAAISTKIAEAVLTRLRFDSRTIQAVTTIVSRHDEPLPLNGRRIKRLLSQLGDEIFLQLLEVIQADMDGQSPAFLGERLQALADARAEYKRIKEQAECFTLAALAVKGEDLLAIGYRPNKALGATLHQLLTKVIDGCLPNERHRLLLEAKKGMEPPT